MTDRRHRTTIQVRFRDTDAFGHVNNAVFLTYVELARVRYLIDVLGLEGPFHRMPLILARVECDFRSPIMFGEEVVVSSSVDRIGRTSFTMSHRVAADERLAADVQSVLVAYDYEAAHPIAVADEWRARFADYEGRSLDVDATAAAAATTA